WPPHWTRDAVEPHNRANVAVVHAEQVRHGARVGGALVSRDDALVALGAVYAGHGGAACHHPACKMFGPSACANSACLRIIRPEMPGLSPPSPSQMVRCAGFSSAASCAMMAFVSSVASSGSNSLSSPQPSISRHKLRAIALSCVMPVAGPAGKVYS